MNERRWSLDIIRIIACFFVVVIHVFAYSIPIDNPKTVEWCFENLVLSIVKSAVPLFFMISGVLFLRKQVSLKKLYTKYIFRIVVVMFVWAAFYAVFDSIKYAEEAKVTARYFILRILSGHYHLWFLPAILGVYICLPLLQLLISKMEKRQVLYLFGVIGVTVLGKVTIDSVLKEFFNTAVWNAFWENFALSGVSVGIVYFLTGYYVDQCKDMISRKNCLLLYGISIVVGAGINLLFAFFLGRDVDFTRELLSIWVYTSSVILFLYLLKRFDKYIPGEKAGNIIKTISGCTFGVYLIHAFFIEQICVKSGMQTGKFSYIPSVIMFSVGVFLCSLAVTWLLKIIPVLGKYIV